MTYKRLGDLLVSIGLLTEENLAEALSLQKKTRKRLGEVLIEYNFISQAQLIEALEMQLGVDFIDLSQTEISPEMAKILPRNLARKHNVVPVRIVKDELFLAMSDPLNFVTIEEVKAATRKRVTPMIATNEGVERAIAALYGNEGATRAIEEMKREVAADSDGGNIFASVTLGAGDDAHAAPTIRLVNSIIERAVSEYASDIHLEPHESLMQVRMRIDGALRNILTVPKQLQSSVISRLKIMASMNIAERKVPQDGRANIRIKSADIDLRVSTLPTIFGEKMTIRLLDKSAQNFTSAGIGLKGDLLNRFHEVIHNSSGVLLIAGPTGTGKSSTMYTIIGELNQEQVNLITLEDPVEYYIEGANQCQINEKVGMTFAGALRSVLRQDPDIIAVGEIRDGETAEIAMRAAITGHLVLSTIHTSDAIATFDRLLNFKVEPYLISGAVKGIISQRLVRRICPQCKTEYNPTEDDLAEMRLIGIENKPDMKLYRGKGCPACFGTGYRGRIGVFEILPIHAELRRLILARASREELLEQARKDGFVTIAESCREMVANGITTVSEAVHTVSSILD